MKMAKKYVICLVFFLCAVQMVSADFIKHKDILKTGHEKLHTWETIFWEFDITKDGFDPVTMDITDATISLVLKDDCDKCSHYKNEWALFIVDGSFEGIWEVDSKTYTFDVSSSLSLNKEGKVSASLTSLWGDFFFNKAILKVNSVASVASVPEPSALSLLSVSVIGLLGMAVRRKKG